MKLDEIRKRVQTTIALGLDYELTNNETLTLLDMLDEAKEHLEFYASALDLPEEQSPYGEPNRDPYLMPARLGTRARELLNKWEESL